ncbi:Crp/Fnr family transcriptional regulator [Sphingobacterium phlebotomi]|uniref:Crp/Fnr family transcriptional regulator n=1 Tax=Sphingobacterium phlebotomi TaxID=2605433 RepID=A0A5D4GV31_9SPHI|nr:Crp/Fnr family transcriptional regulator [Sphingobacterium phlebotomi]TYR32248.1 Crp/Fnr family transcriptional regulator [Sphingobacterium phlebotomi]
MHPLFNYIKEYASTSISEEDFDIFLSHFIKKKIRKKQYLLEDGEICKYFAFIVKGAMRKYYIDEKGIEHIVNLYIENWWAGDRESFVMSTPSIYHIDAWEDCEVLLITRESVLELTQQFPAFNELLLKLDERNNIATQRRITSSISFTAEKRYADFVDCHPYFLHRFPQHIIASYLGITKDTLSQVRRKAFKK